MKTEPLQSRIAGLIRLTVRPVGSHDVDAWTLMRARLWPEATVADLTHESFAFVAGEPGSLLAAAFFVEDDQATPLGFVEVSLRAFSDGCDSMPVPHVEGWYVEPSARRHGVGRCLMDAAEAWARTLGYQEIASDTEIYNAGSLRAHESCGFKEVDRLIKFRKLLA